MRVLRVVTRPNVGGPMRQALALWHAHDAQGVQTLCVTGVCAPDESAFDLAAAGVPLLTPAETKAAGTAAAGFCVLPSLRRAIHPLRDRRARRELATLIASFRPDVVHTHTSKAGWLGRPLARALGVPVVAHTFHGLVLTDYVGRLRSALLRASERRLARITDLCIAVSASCAAELTALRITDRAQVLPPAVPTAAFARAERRSARAALGVGDATQLLGFVGRFVPIKRPLLFAELLQHLPAAHGIALGDGPLGAALATAATRCGDRLRILPTSQRPDSIVAALDLLVLPSRREGFPIVGVEAAAAGVPTIGFDVPGVRDLVDASGAGTCVPERAGIAGLAAAVRGFVAGDCPAPGDRARALIDACSPSRVAERLREAYAGKLSASASRRRR